MAIYLTGDTHGDFSRLRSQSFPAQEGLSKEDYLIICGDFGGVWNRSMEQQFWLNWLEGKRFTTLFVSGNHENYDLLAEFPAEPWHGGLVQRVRPTVLHLMRGQVYELCGKRFFTMGGARSHDIDGGILDPKDPFFHLKRKKLQLTHALYRINHVSWWEEELPSPQEYETARENLTRAGWKVDYIVTHCAPSSVQNALTERGMKTDALTDFLEEVAGRCDFRLWFMGHYHANCVVKERYVVLYQDIIRLSGAE